MSADEQPATGQQVGTPAEQSVHREQATSPAEHNAQFRQTRPDDLVGH
jgi:hypothetical protein